MPHLLRAAASALLISSWAHAASADVIGPPPDDCPEGHKALSDHGGPYCKPPPPESCPAGHRPKVVRDQAYCEPPPSKGCPAGSYWSSTSASDTFCQAASRCEGTPCRAGATCRDTALCVKLRHMGRGAVEVVSGTCAGGGACGQGRCVEAKRCTGDLVQIDPSASASASASAAPSASASASASAAPSASAAASGASSAAPSAAPSASAAPGAPAPGQSGCGACAARGGASGSTAWLWVLGVALAAIGRRRLR